MADDIVQGEVVSSSDNRPAAIGSGYITDEFAVDKIVNATPETISARNRRKKLWGKITIYVRVAVEQVMDMITGIIPGYDLEEKTEILVFSATHCAALAKNEPIDEQAVYKRLDVSTAAIDQMLLIPQTWQKHLDPDFWDLPPVERVKPVRPLQEKDFRFVRQMPYRHELHMAELDKFEPKYRIAA